MASVDIARFSDLGVDALGACDAAPFEQAAASLQARVDDARSGGLSFTYADPITATDVHLTYPWARSLIVAGRAYVPASGEPPSGPAWGRVARFATEDHYVPLRTALRAIAAELREEGYRARVLCDDNRLVDRAAAVRAGLGWWGKSTMVIAPRFGPWMLFGSVITDAEVAPTEPMIRDCGTCVACVPACPTGALSEPGVLDARLCLAAVLQRPGSIPVELRISVGDRLYGCDDCLTACPPGQRLAASEHRGAPVELGAMLRASDEELLERFDHFFIPRRDARYLRRNALVALGNAGTAADLPLLAEYLNHPSGLLRSHAAWALGTVGGPLAREALDTRLSQETVGDVRAEIEAALRRSG